MTTTTTDETTADWESPAGSAARMLIDDIRQLTDEAEHMLATFTPFAERIGAMMAKFDDLAEASEAGEFSSAAADGIRKSTGYDALMDVCWQLLSHASAVADCDTSAAMPAWYETLRARRHDVTRGRSSTPEPAPTAWSAALAAAPVWLNLAALRIAPEVVNKAGRLAGEAETVRRVVSDLSQRAYATHVTIEQAVERMGDLGNDLAELAHKLLGGERLYGAMQDIVDEAGVIGATSTRLPEWAEAAKAAAEVTA